MKLKNNKRIEKITLSVSKLRLILLFSALFTFVIDYLKYLALKRFEL